MQRVVKSNIITLSHTSSSTRQMIAIRIVSPMPTRPRRFCLTLQDDSVFADFDVDPEGHAFLVRISFDGYGCCSCETDVRRLSFDDTRILIEDIDRRELGGGGFQRTLLRYFYENSDVIWSDALEARGLLTTSIFTPSEQALCAHLRSVSEGK
jgi:hypothetical protein